LARDVSGNTHKGIQPDVVPHRNKQVIRTADKTSKGKLIIFGTRRGL